MAQRNAAKHGRDRYAADPHEPQREVVFGPFGGYIPSNPNSALGIGIDPAFLDLRAAVRLTGFVPHEGNLVPDYGWQRHQAALMPLGGYLDAGGYAPSATGQPIVHLVYMPAEVSPNGVEETLAVTAKLAGESNGTVWQYPGYLDPDSWYSMLTITGGAGGGADVIITSSAEIWDSAVYLPGHTVLLTDGVGVNYVGQQSGLLRYYTGRKWGQFPRPVGVSTSFSCASVCAHQDRILVLATREDGVLHSNRIRWTTAGWSTALASPIVLPSANLWNDAGAGAIDIEEDVGTGVAIREMQNHIAVYFRRGMVLLERTGLYTRPYQRTVVTTKRGLIGTQAVTDVGNGIHFGVFTDGWFFVDSSGQFKDVGTTTVQGVTIRKWEQAFYGRLNKDNAYRTIVSYEESRHFIKIAFPDGDEATAPNTVWTYDLHGDRVWPDNYQGAAANNNPLCWGDTTRFNTASAVAIDDAVGTIDDAVGVYDTFATLERRIFSHGTEGGVVLQHVASLIKRDGDIPTFEYLSAPQAFGDPSQFKQLQQFLIHYVKTRSLATTPEGDAAWINFTLYDGLTSEPVVHRVIVLDNIPALSPGVEAVWFRHPLIQVQIGITGLHPFILRGFELEWLNNMGDLR